jgi:hypothetical protein
VSAHPGIRRSGLFAAAAAQISGFLLEPVEPVAAIEPVELEPYPVVAVVSAGPRSGATTVARAVGAELAARADGAAVVSCVEAPRRAPAPPLRAAARVATALRGVGDGRIRPVGRLCLVPGAAPAELASAGRYLAPVVLDVPPDGSALRAAAAADRVVVVASAAHEPALLEALARMLAAERQAIRVVTRVVEPAEWQDRADVLLPESRVAARAAHSGARPLGRLGHAVSELVDALEDDR